LTIGCPIPFIVEFYFIFPKQKEKRKKKNNHVEKKNGRTTIGRKKMNK